MSDELREILGEALAPWRCFTCGSGYAEYVNSCPHCWEAGIRSKVERVPEILGPGRWD